MKAADYNSATLKIIRDGASSGRRMIDVANELGWDLTMLESICRKDRITFPKSLQPTLSERTNLWPAERAADRNR